MTSYQIRIGEKKDLPAVYGLIKDLAMFEKAPDSVTNTIERMEKEQAFFHFFVAEFKGEIVGMALYFFAYYSWVGKSLYLDDLYVKPAHRGKRIGIELLKKIYQVALDEDCQRLRWQVLDWNTEAVKLYQSIGAEISSEWYNCDVKNKNLTLFLDTL
jgi:GNAT superfamily N-acetyltransferase